MFKLGEITPRLLIAWTIVLILRCLGNLNLTQCLPSIMFGCLSQTNAADAIKIYDREANDRHASHVESMARQPRGLLRSLLRWPKVAGIWTWEAGY